MTRKIQLKRKSREGRLNTFTPQSSSDDFEPLTGSAASVCCNVECNPESDCDNTAQPTYFLACVNELNQTSYSKPEKLIDVASDYKPQNTAVLKEITSQVKDGIQEESLAIDIEPPLLYVDIEEKPIHEDTEMVAAQPQVTEICDCATQMKSAKQRGEEIKIVVHKPLSECSSVDKSAATVAAGAINNALEDDGDMLPSIADHVTDHMT